MKETCLFEILELPDETLRTVLSKTSARVIMRLLAAYPRTVSHDFLLILSECMSPSTVEFLREGVNMTEVPSFPQIRAAESELMKIVQEEGLAQAKAA